MVLVGVLQIGVLLFERLEVVSLPLQLFFEPLDTMFKFLDVLALVKGGSILHCGRHRGPLPHGIVARHSGVTLGTTLSEILVVRPVATPHFAANLLQHFVWEIRSHLVLKDGDLFDHHLRVCLPLAILQLAEHALQLLPH